MKQLAFLLLIFLAVNTYGQSKNQAQEFEKETLNNEMYSNAEYKNEIIKYDLSHFWQSGEYTNILGFIGENYQRLRIRIISVTRDKSKPDTYHVTGKSMVKNNVNRFSGTITVAKVRTLKEGSWGVDDDYTGQNIKNLGLVIARYNFAEDKTQPGSGVFEGVLVTDWLIDKDSKIQLDEVTAGADGYRNNQYVGTWKSYQTGAVKTANWGDDRIPMSGDLDLGAGEFYPDKKYWKFGWQSYIDAYTNSNKKALREEERKWWQ